MKVGKQHLPAWKDSVRDQSSHSLLNWQCSHLFCGLGHFWCCRIQHSLAWGWCCDKTMKQKIQRHGKKCSCIVKPGQPNTLTFLTHSDFHVFWKSLQVLATHSKCDSKVQSLLRHATPPTSPIWPYILLTGSPPLHVQFVFLALPCMDWSRVTRTQIHEPNHVIALNLGYTQCIFWEMTVNMFMQTLCKGKHPNKWK